MNGTMQEIKGSLNYLYEMSRVSLENKIGINPHLMDNHEIGKRIALPEDFGTAVLFVFNRNVVNIQAEYVAEFLEGLANIRDHPLRGWSMTTDPLYPTLTTLQHVAHQRGMQQALQVVADALSRKNI